MKKKTKPEVAMFLCGQIDEASLAFILELYKVSQQHPGSIINLFLSSSGGDESVGFAIYDAMRAIPNDIHIYGYGQVCSIAALLLQAGDKRYLSPNSVFMIHNGSIVINEAIEFDKLQKITKDYTKNNSKYHKALALASDTELKAIEKFCVEERFFSAEEAVAHGFADGVCEGFLCYKK